MDTDTNMQLAGFVSSEQFLDNDNQSTQSTQINEYIKRYQTQSTQLQNHQDENKNSELLSILEASVATWNIDTNNNIAYGLDNLQFEYGLNENQLEYEFLRLRSHLTYTTACANAAFFVGIANRIRRDLENLKKGFEIIQKTSILLTEMKKIPGLQIGIIGGGKLGRQLAEALLNFSKVNPEELQISTRQPDTLLDLIKKNVRCYFDNALIAKSVNILFLCVLPTQLQNVIDDIKPYLPERCIIYSLVRTEAPLHIKNLLGNITNIIKPNYLINLNITDLSKWNYSLSLTECLLEDEMIETTNPFLSHDEMSFKVNEHYLVSIIYALFNICLYLKLNKKESLYAIKKFLFSSCKKPVKVEENFFFEPPTGRNSSDYFPFMDLVDVTLKTTPLFYKIKTSKTFKFALKTCYLEYFNDVKKFKDSFI